MPNIKVNEKLDASEFEVLLSKIITEKPFKDKTVQINNYNEEGKS